MSRLPWGGGNGGKDESEESPDAEPSAGDPITSCECQDGELSVYEDRVHIERTSRSKFADKTIAIEEVQDVTYESRLVISYVQIEQAGFDTEGEGILSTPVDENTLHFGRGKRDCLRRAMDTIIEQMASV